MRILTSNNKTLTIVGNPLTSNSSILDGGGGGPSLDFTTTWKTDNLGASADDEIQLPLVSTGTYNFNVDWGDGNDDDITAWDQAETLHSYAAAGTYTVTITGEITGWTFVFTGNLQDPQKIVDVSSWGPLTLGIETNHFKGCTKLDVTAMDGATATSTLAGAFSGCTLLTNVGGTWNTTGVTNLSATFEFCPVFDGDIDGWDVSAVTTMSLLFRDAVIFNKSVNSWDTSSVIILSNVFRGCTLFNQDLNNWDTSQVTTMERTFVSAPAFNEDISTWVTTKVLSMDNMFTSAVAFNGDIGGWDVSSVTKFERTFFNAQAFNQDISSWVTSSATNMSFMFQSALAFNQDIGGWDVSKVTTMEGMFQVTAFDQDIGGWNIGLVTNMTAMFEFNSISTANYDALLIGFEGQTVQTSVAFHGGTSTYSAGAATTARADLIANSSWTITDGGQV